MEWPWNGPFPMAMIAWGSMLQHNTAWSCLAWPWQHGLAWSCMAWLGPAQHGAACLSVAWPSTAQDGPFSLPSPGSLHSQAPCLDWGWVRGILAGPRGLWCQRAQLGALWMVPWGKWRSQARDKASVGHTFISMSLGHNMANPHCLPCKPLVQSGLVATASQPSHAGTPARRGASGPDSDTASRSVVCAWVKTWLRVLKRVPRPWLRGV